jgi:hypothetical protein
MRPEAGPQGTPWVTETHHFAGFIIRHTGRRTFEFNSRTSSQVYTLDLDADPPCSCWPSTRRTASLGVCPHIRAISLLLKKLNQQTP